jgi:hypothetical protein
MTRGEVAHLGGGSRWNLIAHLHRRQAGTSRDVLANMAPFAICLS